MEISTHLIIPDPHAHYQHNNDRATLAGKLINDVKPDVVVVLGDVADMPSLSSYDKGKKAFQGRTYRQDIDSHNDFQDRLWSTVRRAKRKLPRRVALIGNHEQRIERAIDFQPELDGVISYKDLDLERYYDDVIQYNGSSPGSTEIDGVHYAHFMVSGVMGQPISGEHPGYSILSKHHASCTVGHSHCLDYCSRVTKGGQRIHGFVAGCFIDAKPSWAGYGADFWWSGVAIKRFIRSGDYDLQCISMARLKREYGK